MPRFAKSAGSHGERCFSPWSFPWKPEVHNESKNKIITAADALKRRQYKFN
jgi:hypothetical protein